MKVFSFVRHSISTRILILYLTFNTIIVFIFGSSIFVISTRILEKEVTHYTEKIIEQASFYFNANISDVNSRIVSLASNRTISRALSTQEMSIQQRLDLDRKLDSLLKKSDLFNPIIEDIFIIGNNGYVYNIAGRTDLISDYPFTKQPWYQQTIDNTNNTYIHMLSLHPQNFYNSRVRADRAYNDTASVSIAIANANRVTVGAVICNFNLNALGKILMSSNYEKSGKIALLDESGQIVSQSDNSEVGSFLSLDNNARETVYGQTIGTLKSTIGDKSCLIHFQTTSVGWKLVSYVPLSEIRRHNNPIFNSFLIALIICFLANCFISLALSKSIHRPIKRLVENIYKVDFDNLTLEQSVYEFTEFEQITEKFNDLLNELDLLIKRDYKSQILLNRLRLYSLQSQINPHFLMNTLQLLQTEIVYGNVETSNEIIVSLGKLLRYTLYHYEKEVLISEELAYIKGYLMLFVKKYNGELFVKYYIDESIYNYYMPKLLLQPAVENCIKHAFCDNPQNAQIKLEAHTDGTSVMFIVSDNGIGMDAEQLKAVRENLTKSNINDDDIGLRNIHQRIQMLYGTSYGICIESIKEYGCRISVRIPIIKEVENHEAINS